MCILDSSISLVKYINSLSNLLLEYALTVAQHYGFRKAVLPVEHVAIENVDKGEQIVEDCIFVSTPKECSTCLRTRKLPCLLNHQHLRLREAAKEELKALLVENMESLSRYKTISGEEGRHR